MKILPVLFMVLCAIAVSVIKVDAKPFQYLDLIIEDDVAKEEIESRTFFWNNKPEKENRKKVVILVVDAHADDTEGSDEVIPQKPQNKPKTTIKRKKVERLAYTHYHDSREDDTDSSEYEHNNSNENKHNLYENEDESEEVDYEDFYRPYPGRYPQSPTLGNSGPSNPWGSNSWETPAWTSGNAKPYSGEDQDQDYGGDTYEYNGGEAEDMDIPTGSEEEAVYSRIESGVSPFDGTEDEAYKSSEMPEKPKQGEEMDNSGESLELSVSPASHLGNTEDIVREDIQIVTKDTQKQNDDESQDMDYDDFYRPGRYPHTPTKGHSESSTQWGTNSSETAAWTTADEMIVSGENQDQDYEGGTYEYNGEKDMDISTSSEGEAVYSRIESGGPFDSTEEEADKSSEIPEKPGHQGEETENAGVESGNLEGDTQEQIVTEEPETVLISQQDNEFVTQGAFVGEGSQLPESTKIQPESTVENVTEAEKVLVETTEILSNETKNGADHEKSQDKTNNATKVQGSNNQEDSVTYVEKINDKESATQQETGDDELFKHYYYHVPQPILLTYFQRKPSEEDEQNDPEQDSDEPRSGFRLGSLQHKAKKVIKKIVRNKYKIINRKTDDLLG